MNKMMRLRILALCFAALLSACGGGGGDGAPAAPAPLTGTWFGTLEDAVSVMHTISITVNGTTITAIAVDGVSTGQTGTITQQSGQIYGYVLSDGVEGGFFVDSLLTYATFADDDLSFGVVQRSATSLPTYFVNDISRHWGGIGGVAGISVETDFITFTQVSSSATCTSSNPVTCTVTRPAGTSNVTFSGPFDPTFGRWTGTYTGPGSESGGVAAFLSPDKQFVGAWACEGGGSWPEDCEFSAWRF